jgi:hypothetical protein
MCWIFIKCAVNGLAKEVIEMVSVFNGRIDREAFNRILKAVASIVLDDKLTLARKRNDAELFH